MYVVFSLQSQPLLQSALASCCEVTGEADPSDEKKGTALTYLSTEQTAQLWTQIQQVVHVNTCYCLSNIVYMNILFIAFSATNADVCSHEV